MITADLKGKTALVTGGASGIGLAIVEKLAGCGARVAINDLPGSERLAREVARLHRLGREVHACPGDVGNPADAGRMVKAAAEALGGLDYLVNNAATPGTSSPIPPGDFARMDEAFWQKLVSVNQIGPYRCLSAAAPYLKKSHGAVVNVASTAGLGRAASSSVYAATKAALILLTKEWARALGPEVRVNAVAPHLVEGSGWDCKWTPEDIAKTIAHIPLRRAGRPEDYAEVIFFLLAGAGYMSGETVVVDGGGIG
jgi:NAD(P)-dependent dehydrogenase (short-subunit alcohol dehydrogenase family)